MVKLTAGEERVLVQFIREQIREGNYMAPRIFSALEKTGGHRLDRDREVNVTHIRNLIRRRGLKKRGSYSLRGAVAKPTGGYRLFLTLQDHGLTQEKAFEIAASVGQ